MIKRTTHMLALLAVFASAGHQAQAALDVGDRAPPLTISEWVQGKPVDFKKDLGKKVYLVEFWAVWCPPCKASVPRLTKIQNQHKSDLTVIGVTAPDFRGNTPTTVRQFVKQQGAKMSYAVAIDRDMATTDAYLTAARVNGIPHAFLIDKSGKIVWQGSPLEPQLEGVIDRVVGGMYDVAAAKLEAQADKVLQQRVVPAVQAGRWDAVWDGLLAVLDLDPGHDIGLNFLLQIHIDHMQDRQTYREWCREHIAKHRSDARVMLTLATALVDRGELAFRKPDLALEAAKAAYQATNGRNGPAVEVYARALYQIGDLDRAIALQEEAMTVANDGERADAQAVRDFYKKCRELRASLG